VGDYCTYLTKLETKNAHHIMKTCQSLTRGVHFMALPFTLKRILRQQKNYGNSNISPCKKYGILKNSFKRNPNPSRYYNFIINLKFQFKP
jgi:hypothetical protein